LVRVRVLVLVLVLVQVLVHVPGLVHALLPVEVPVLAR
jgi:hypothetical protein